MPVTTRSPKAAAQDTGWRLEFPAGIPAFEQETAFVLLRPPETEPLVFLQSEKTAGLCFLAVPVERVVPDYELALSAEDRISVGFAEKRPAAPGELVTFAILTPVGRDITANLLAPVVVNVASGKAVQAVRSDNRYSARTPVRFADREAGGC